MLRETLNALLALTLCSVLGIAGAHAAEAPEPAREEQAQSNEDAESAEADADDADKDGDAAPSREIFIPTEEISEDFAVSFPVDI